jgi:ligand-binding SRPBCC domain-containing protein
VCAVFRCAGGHSFKSGSHRTDLWISRCAGPYRLWIHTHTFDPHQGGTLARDVMRYAVPLDFVVQPLLVHPDIERIFAFWQAALREEFGCPQ